MFWYASGDRLLTRLHSLASSRAQIPPSSHRQPDGPDINTPVFDPVPEAEPFHTVPSLEVPGVPDSSPTARNEGHMELMQYARMPIPTLPPRAEMMGRNRMKGPTADWYGNHLVDGSSVPSTQLDGPSSHLGHHSLDGPVQQPASQPRAGPSYGLVPDGPPASKMVGSGHAHLDGPPNRAPGPSKRPGPSDPPGPSGSSVPSSEAPKSQLRRKEKEPMRTQQQPLRFLRNLLGTTVSAAYLCRDTHNVLATFFVLSDLSVREEGTYQLRLSLSALSPNALNHHGQASEGVTPIVTSLYTPEFCTSSLASKPHILSNLSKLLNQLLSLH